MNVDGICDYFLNFLLLIQPLFQTHFHVTQPLTACIQHECIHECEQKQHLND